MIYLNVILTNMCVKEQESSEICFTTSLPRLFFKILSISSNVKDIHFMLQKEVVDRMIVDPVLKSMIECNDTSIF